MTRVKTKKRKKRTAASARARAPVAAVFSPKRRTVTPLASHVLLGHSPPLSLSLSLFLSPLPPAT